MIIPNSIEVGFCKRKHKSIKGVDGLYHDGPSYLLGYATFIDKGKFRKEKSWNDWRDHNIPPQTLNNVPREGFKFAEFDKRSTEWFSSGRTMWRISDPYGFDLEITSANLAAIICNTNINEGQFDGEFVWAWEGKNLALVTVNSDVYKEAVETTRKKYAKTIKTAELSNGDEFETSDEKKYIYIGKVWGIYAGSVDSYAGRRSASNKIVQTRRGERLHVVMHDNGSFELLTSIKPISFKPSGKTNVPTLDSFILSYMVAKESADLIRLHTAEPNHKPITIPLTGDSSRVHYALSIDKIKVADLIEEPVNIVHELETLKKIGKTWNLKFVPIFAKIEFDKYFMLGNKQWEKETVTNDWRGKTIPAQTQAYIGKFIDDDKKNKKDFVCGVTEGRSFYDGRKIDFTMLSEPMIHNRKWFRYFIELNGKKYLV